MTDHTIAAIIYEAMLWGNDQPKRPNSLIAYAPFGNSDAEVEARRFADRIVDLRGAIEPQPDPRDEVIARLVEALEFYADMTAWTQPPVKTREGLLTIEYENQASKMQKDRGAKARAALAAALRC